MHRRTTSAAVLALTTLTLPGCSTSPSAPPEHPSPATAQHNQPSSGAKPATLISSALLRERLLDESDLGAGYIRKPDSPSDHDDVAVTGCPPLKALGGAAASGSLDFPRRAKTTFAYTDSGSAISEDLYSDTEAQLSRDTGRIFDAMTACPSYQVVAGGTPVGVTVRKVPSPRVGDEQWSLQMTYTAGVRTTVVKQTTIRIGTVVVSITGSPGLVDAHLDKALSKARSIH
ncbi:hypothetical protein ACIRQP_39990 [Streptomyces sp. NPDC102274]|uniref:hypothetical protein n=1 Tax=Streptomyces sp. NPDC102274 TaxID=3366151 RepID=UPI0037F2F47E